MHDDTLTIGSAADLAAIVEHGADAELCAADVRLLLEITSVVSAHGALLDAIGALRGKLRRKLAVATEIPAGLAVQVKCDATHGFAPTAEDAVAPSGA